MPYLQLDLEAKKLVPRVARALGVPDAQIGWGLIELWDWCWNAKKDTVKPIMLHGFFGSAGEHLGATLEAFGFLELISEEYRVRGATRYLRISDAQSGNGKARAKGAKRDAKGRLVASSQLQPPLVSPPADVQPPTSRQPALSPKNTEHRTPNTEEIYSDPESLPLLTAEESEATDDGARLVAHYVNALAAQRITVKATVPRKELVRKRLGEGWTYAQLLKAVNGFTYSDWHMGRDPKTNGRTYHALEDYCLETDSQIESWIALYEQNERGVA